jgi:hypothetical protein
MPDIDRLVQDALLEYVPTEITPRVYVKPPVDWAEQMPFIAVKWTGGHPSSNSTRLQVRDVVVKVYALDQASGNEAIRHVEQALKTACLQRFNNNVPDVTTPGVLCNVREVSPIGLQYEGLTSKHPDSALFEGMFRTISAPLLP